MPNAGLRWCQLASEALLFGSPPAGVDLDSDAFRHRFDAHWIPSRSPIALAPAAGVNTQAQQIRSLVEQLMALVKGRLQKTQSRPWGQSENDMPEIAFQQPGSKSLTYLLPAESNEE